ncbi:carotenoid biosynthesis protein [uncultured Polaribacter sp.]|uniref:carotenoid biosynthesis protein n=1 Tax=uncultured Polaribacter sp. TaxID=174711 RepID=UPI00260A9E91|nr:carotenoid biosynthesis protein [uncultured Polaribacter sp.]
MIKMIAKYKVYISIFTVWLFNISGILGILSSQSEWFLSLTPLNLMLNLVFILWNLDKINSRFFLAFSIPFFIGFLVEYLGVNYSLFFGTYVYGENLGYKIGGVPLMICVNWGVLTVITADLAQIISKNTFVRFLLGGLLMMLLDIVIEISAPRFDFWEFENGVVPLKNYIAWFVIAAIAHFFYNKFQIQSHKKVSIHILIAITVFFSTFLFF